MLQSSQVGIDLNCFGDILGDCWIATRALGAEWEKQVGDVIRLVSMGEALCWLVCRYICCQRIQFITCKAASHAQKRRSFLIEIELLYRQSKDVKLVVSLGMRASVFTIYSELNIWTIKSYFVYLSTVFSQWLS